MPDRTRIRAKFSLGSTFLALALVCVLSAWWVDRNRERPSYFFHVIASTHDLQYEFDPKIQQHERYEHAQIFTATIVPNESFYFGSGRTTLPGREIMLAGRIDASGKGISGGFYFQMDNPDDSNQTIQYNHDGEIELDALNRMWQGKRYWILSESNDTSYIYGLVRSTVDSEMEDSSGSRDNKAMSRSREAVAFGP